MLRALWVFPGDPSEDSRLLVRLHTGQDSGEALPHRAARKLDQIDVKVTKARVELSVGPVRKITQIATFHAYVLMDHPVNLAAS